MGEKSAIEVICDTVNKTPVKSAVLIPNWFGRYHIEEFVGRKITDEDPLFILNKEEN